MQSNPSIMFISWPCRQGQCNLLPFLISEFRFSGGAISCLWHYLSKTHLNTDVMLIYWQIRFPTCFVSLQQIPFGTIVNTIPVLWYWNGWSRYNTKHTHTFPKHMIDSHMHSQQPVRPPSEKVEMLLTAAFRIKFHYTHVYPLESHPDTHTHRKWSRQIRLSAGQVMRASSRKNRQNICTTEEDGS